MDEALLDAAIRGWSHNTRRAFRSDLILWGTWCRRRRMVPARAGPGDVAAWIRALSGADPSEETVRAMATIERYVVNVGWAYRIAGLRSEERRVGTECVRQCRSRGSPYS